MDKTELVVKSVGVAGDVSIKIEHGELVFALFFLMEGDEVARWYPGPSMSKDDVRNMLLPMLNKLVEGK